MSIASCMGKAFSFRLQATNGATILIRRGICVNCTPFYYRWQLLSVLPAPAPGPNEVVEGMVAAVDSMGAVVVVDFMRVGVADFVVATAVGAFAVVMVEAASVAVPEVIEAATVAGDPDAVGVVGDLDVVGAVGDTASA